MPSLLLTRIEELVTNDPEVPCADGLGLLRDAAVVIEHGQVAWVGPSAAAPAADRNFDCHGGALLPGFVDSHSHVVFAGDRAAEFAARMAGTPYSAGGIRTTVQATREATDEQLAVNAGRLCAELLRGGSTTFEIKTGYGLTVHDEARSVEVARRFTDEVTFLGAHVVAPEYAEDRDAYVELVAGPMLEACAPHARWIDVFCDRGAFDADEARRILRAGIESGLTPRVHANQLQHGPGVQVAVEVGAASADHCTHLSEADVSALADSQTVATLLPGAEFSTRSAYPDARRLLDAGVHVALATDCNPGTSYTTSMSLCIALAVREMHMTVPEAVRAATVGGARALRRPELGRVVVGGPADLVLLDAPSYVHLAYRPGVDLIAQVWQGGRPVRSPDVS
ncbi:MAG: imidazolonepropionase [Candidatus Nanopelagicales bacterium]|nr:imidazolonepropionase [Candidatus Nanopelagicales bacterium]